ncbi:MAG TPA: rhomboid family intramembrane serine protease [Candidatus Marinimicrobia bacterium]|nr:rhomboid family intramembrane serine protease [Candidatus Neomarinimicrobiota bacterium]HRU92380.1 rhomboid family intramembrane serine protease [Candidatus Neomarinimicrobiota bacterium]
MNNYNYYQSPRSNSNYIRPRLFRGAVGNIIIANVVVFLVMLIFQAQNFFPSNFGLVPTAVLKKGYIWQLFTYMFIHGGFGHLFWNMFVLWMFGMEIENYWGKREFYKFYFITGVGSGLITMLFSAHSEIPVVGASGAIYGVLVAFAMLFPERYIYFYFLIPIKAKYFAIIMVVITFFSTMSPGTSNISHLTHLGGLAIGYLYLARYKLLAGWRRRAGSVNWHWPRPKVKNPFRNLRLSPRHKKTKAPKEQIPFSYETEETMREELDRILDKISTAGYDRLSEQERSTLYLLSKYFAEKDRHKS